MALKEVLVNALIGKYEAQISEAKANISVFLENIIFLIFLAI